MKLDSYETGRFYDEMFGQDSQPRVDSRHVLWAALRGRFFSSDWYSLIDAKGMCSCRQRAYRRPYRSLTPLS